MKYLWILMINTLIGCAGCENRPDPAATFPHGAVTHVAFAEIGKSLVVVNEFSSDSGRRERCHTRLRRFSTSDWKMTADSGELSLINFNLAAADKPVWAAQAQEFDRHGRGNPRGGVAIYKVDAKSLRLDPADTRPRGTSLGSIPLAQSNTKPLCAVLWNRKAGTSMSKEPPATAFVFDLEAGKITVELEDFPTTGIWEPFAKTIFEFTPDGKQIVSCSPTKPFQIQLHAAETGKLVASTKLDSPATALKYSPNGKTLAALCRDGTVLILATDLSKSVHSLKVAKHRDGWGSQSPQSMVFPSNEILAVVSASQNIEFFETKEWKSVNTITVEKNQVNCIASSPDGKLIAAGLGRQLVYPTKVHVYEIKAGKLIAELD
jgi:hypothetical protein